MNTFYCCRCLVPLSRRERLFESLLCSACEQKLTNYGGPLPNPNLAFTKRAMNLDGSEVHLSSGPRSAQA